jgi:hypothetical protein
MRGLLGRLKKLEEAFTDGAGLVPQTQKWLLYWDRQYSLYLSGQDLNAIAPSGVAEYRAVTVRVNKNETRGVKV